MTTDAFRMPARQSEPSDRIEDHDYERCEFCGEFVTDWGCRCDDVDRQIDDELENW